MWATILASILTSTVVSGIFLLTNGWRERKARLKQMQFELAYKMAESKISTGVELAKLGYVTVGIPDAIHLTETYFNWICYFHKHKTLPQEAKDAQAASIRRQETVQKPNVF